MSKTGKIITGILSFLPIVLFIGQFIVFFIFFFRLYFNLTPDPAGLAYDDEALFVPLVAIVVMILLVGVIGIGMLIYLLVHANKNPKFNDDDRMIWVILLVVLGILIFPVYWYIGIWKDKPLDPVIK